MNIKQILGLGANQGLTLYEKVIHIKNSNLVVE